MRLDTQCGSVNVRQIDHLNLRIPADGADAARQFYGERLGFDIEDEHYETGEKSFFDARLTPTAVIHLWPTDDFESPSPTNFNHVCLAVADDIETVKSRLADADVDIERELAAPLGATGEAPSVYVTDPFGYQLELTALPEQS